MRAVSYDHGNDRVQARREDFRVFQGGKADQEIADPIGRAWAVGLLDGQAYDAAVLRDAGREYAGLYWMYYQGGAKTMQFGVVGRGSKGGGIQDQRERRFNSMDDAARCDAGSFEQRRIAQSAYQAMQALCVSTYWFPDDNPAWLDRLINEARAKARQSVVGELPVSGDRDMLDRAIAGLVAMVSG